MIAKRFPCFLTLLMVLAAVAPASAQDDLETAPTSAIKKIAISFDGGTYSGMEYFGLQKLNERAQLEAGTHFVALYDGTVLQMDDGQAPNRFDAPRKEIESGKAFSTRIGFYLSDAFHVDLLASLAIADAKISLLKIEDGLEAGRFNGSEADGFLDTGFKSMSGGLQLGYDATSMKYFGLSPNFGMGFGGIINRFSVLEDKTAFYFQLYGGLSREILKNIQARFRVTANTYSFETEEVNYGRQVTTTTLTLGLTWLFNANPIHGYHYE